MGKVKVGNTGISPCSASVPPLISLSMVGVFVLNWYPKRNPSQEMRMTTGPWSFDRGLSVETEEEEDVEENSKKPAEATATERAMQVEITSNSLVRDRDEEQEWW